MSFISLEREGCTHAAEEHKVKKKKQNSLSGISGPLLVLSQPKETLSKSEQTHSVCKLSFSVSHRIREQWVRKDLRRSD